MSETHESLLATWVAQLDHEREQQELLLALGERKTAAVVTCDQQALRQVLVEEENRFAETTRLRRLRESLVRASARFLNIPHTGFRLGLLLEGGKGTAAEQVQALRQTLRSLSERLHRIHDRNHLLMRTSLEVVRGVLTQIAGPPARDGYGRNGQDYGHLHNPGNLLDLRV